MKIIHVFMMFIYLMACAAPNQKRVESIFEIDFQDYFKNDTISLAIDSQSVVSNLIVNSDTSVGLTALSVRFFIIEEGVQVKYGAESVLINKLTFPVEIILSLNGYRNKYLIDLNKGKYVGFSKKIDKSFYFYQADEAFEYD